MIVALFVALLLFVATLPIAKRVAIAESDPRMVKLVMWGVSLHLLFAPVSIYVVGHFYQGLTDYSKYIGQGAVLAHNFDSFQFTLAGSKLLTPVGAGTVSIVTGIIFAVIGVNKLAAFLIFGWLAFLGSICFFRAYAITFPDAEHRRYALMIFFLPSLLFWTAGVSKETLMYASLGVAAYGAARIMARRHGGVVLLVVGSLVGLYVRPQEFLLFFAAVAGASIFRGRSRRPLGSLRSIAVLAVEVSLIVVAVALTKHVRGVFSLSAVAQNNQGEASSIPYSSSPLAYPRDLYYLLFDPLPFNAHGSGQRVAALENSVIIVLILMSIRRLRCLPRVMFMRPYVMAAMLYSIVFVYAFAALANLGLIDRERVVLLPFILVFLCIPVTEKGQPPRYPWELSRRDRRPRPRWSSRAGT